MIAMGMAKKTSSQRPPGRSRRYGVSRPRPIPVSRSRAHFEEEVVPLGLLILSELLVRVRVRQLILSRHDGRSQRVVVVRVFGVAVGAICFGVRHDLLLDPTHTREVADVLGDERRAGYSVVV